MKVILPLQQTFTNTFNLDADAVSILLNYDKSYPWLMNNFIQLSSWGDEYLGYYDFNYRNCPLIKYQRIMREVVDYTGMGFCDFVRAAIDRGYYVIVPVITTYISAYDYIGMHEMLVYGYEGKELFYIADHFSGGKYQKVVCSTAEFERATAQMTDRATWRNGFYGNFELLIVTKKSWAKLEPQRIKWSLEDYLESRPTSSWYVNVDKWDGEEFKNRVYGLDCYQTLFHHISLMEGGEFRQSGVRAFYLQWEHKKIMCERIDYLKREFAISQELCKQMKEIQDLAMKAKMLAFKFNIKRDITILKRMSELEVQMKEKEIIAYSSLAKAL